MIASVKISCFQSFNQTTTKMLQSLAKYKYRAFSLSIKPQRTGPDNESLKKYRAFSLSIKPQRILHNT